MPARKSLVDAAYDVLTRRYDEKNESVPMAFNELLLAVGKELGITEESELIDIASKFYTSLTVDGRFVIKENNTWVLRDHELFSNIHIDMNAVTDDGVTEVTDYVDMIKGLLEEGGLYSLFNTGEHIGTVLLMILDFFF